MQRRTFLQVAGNAVLWSGLARDLAQRAQALTPGKIASSDPDVHLLRRISFGPTVQELARVRKIGRAAYIDEQLTATDLGANLGAAALYPRINTAGGLIYTTTALGLNTGSHVLDLQCAMLYRALYSKAQLKEVMVDFWNDHFNTYIRKNPIPLKLDLDREVIRKHALGNFKTLLHATVRNAEMLFFLDNWVNTTDSINENYARELLELHTLGKGGGYTEDDMRALARILTGLSYLVDLPLSPLLYGTVQFNAAKHDKTQKQFLGANFPAGGGEAEIDRALDLILRHPGTAQHIARKLCERFVADTAPDTLVARVADTFTSTGGDIPAMLRLILNSDEFAQSGGAKYKRPLDATIGAMRACGTNPFDLLNTALFGLPVAAPNGTLFNGLKSAGQEPFAWVPPNGYPDTAAYWANTNALLYLEKFVVSFVEGTAFNRILARPLAVLGGLTVADAVVAAKTPRQAATHAIANLLFVPLPSEAVDACVAFMAQNDGPDTELAQATLTERAKGLVFVLLCSPWFLLR
jgi:uncharacterized protein (DUF1800 family)